MSGLYTVRVRLVPTIYGGRGADWVEMTHHLQFSDDDAALDGFATVAGAWVDSGIADRWCVVRGVPIHTVDLYRRNISNPSSWVHLGSGSMTFGEWSETSTSIVVEGVTIGVDLAERPIYPVRRSAVMVLERTGNRDVQRRVYVGPISPTCLFANVGVSIGESRLLVANPFNGDFPPDPDEDSVDLWRTDIRDLARDHCANIEDYAGDGVGVVPSWKHGIVLPILETSGADVRAEVRSRGCRRALGPPTSG